MRYAFKKYNICNSIKGRRQKEGVEGIYFGKKKDWLYIWGRYPKSNIAIFGRFCGFEKLQQCWKCNKCYTFLEASLIRLQHFLLEIIFYIVIWKEQIETLKSTINWIGCIYGVDTPNQTQPFLGDFVDLKNCSSAGSVTNVTLFWRLP